MKKLGFTLIELLIVIAVITIIAAIIFVTLDPLTRFREARDSKRWAETSAILNAIKVDQVDNGGRYIAAVAGMTEGDVYMIVDGAVATGCDDQNANCDTDVTDDTSCVNLAGLSTEGYLGAIPISPNGAGAWTASITGYTVQRDASGIITVRACESESGDEIWTVR